MIKSRLERLITYSRGSTGRHVHELRAGQWLDASSSRADQDRRLRALLLHAARHVPYYREVLAEAGVCESPGRVLVDRFAQIPFLDKGTMRTRFGDLNSDDLSTRTWNYDSTGGSTGEPVRLVHDSDYADWGRALSIVGNCLACRRPDETKLYLWGSVRDLTGQETLRARLGQWMRNEVWLNSFRMTPDLMHSCVELVNQSRPDHIIGYVESIVELARLIERNGLAVHSPKTVATAAGSLLPHMRELVQGVFRAEVFDQYGSREVATMATECDRHEGLHVPSQAVLVEVLRDDGTPAEPGETGRIVVTSLVNYAMPLIRYAIGDLGAWAEAPCSCGRVWPLLRSITGRVSDTFVTADGTLVAGQYFHYVFFLQDWVEKFQVVQESARQIRARIVRRKDMPDVGAAEAAGLEEIVHKVHLAMGDDCNVAFEFVNDIAPSASGKYRFTVSKVRDAP